MSLYDKFHSDINMNHMYNLVCGIIKEDTNEDISTNTEYKELFNKNCKEIFKSINTEDISVINKIVLDKNVKEINDLINSKKILDKTTSDRYSEMMALRNKPIEFNETNNIENNIPASNTLNEKSYELQDIQTDNSKQMNPFLNLQDNTSDKEKVEIETKEEIEEKIEVKEESEEIKIKGEKINEKIKVEKYPEYKIFSSKRSNIHSSRYNYIYNLKNNNIKSSEIKKITKMIIPIEDNYIFSMPILFLKIKELDINITLELDKILENENRKFGHYKVIENHNIDISDVEKITIDIRDNTETKYDHIDIAKVNIIELKKDEIHFTCTNIEKNNYNIGDYIKIINNYTRSFKSLVYPLKIKRIEKNILICDFNSKINKKYSDVDMKLLNTSNQNIIYFN